ncbi:MAG: nuclear transport factor 2 family protein [Pseudomonadota bacterium]
MASTPIAENKEIVREFLSVFSRGDVAGIVERLHPDATWWVSGTMPGLSDTYSRQQMGELLKGVTTVYKLGALRITPLSMIAEGSMVAVEAESYAELNNGRVYNNFYHFLFEIADGKILRVKEYMDTQHAYDTFLKP